MLNVSANKVINRCVPLLEAALVPKICTDLLDPSSMTSILKSISEKMMTQLQYHHLPCLMMAHGASTPMMNQGMRLLSTMTTLWVRLSLWLKNVAFRPMESCYRFRLMILEPFIATSCCRTDDWSICSMCRSSSSFSHNLSTFQPGNLQLIKGVHIMVCLCDCINSNLWLESKHPPATIL